MKKTKDYRFAAIILLFLSLAFMIITISELSKPKEKNTNTETLVYNKDGHNEAYIASQLYCKEAILSPESAKFDSWTADPIVDINDNIFTVSYHFDAKNAFGSVIRNKYVCRMKYVGGPTFDIYNSEGYLNYKLESLVINNELIYP